MLGVADVRPTTTPADLLLREYARRASASATPTPRPASACSSASRARPSPTRSSAARARTAPAASRCGALHGRLPARRQEHAASRTTCGSPSARRARSCPSARSIDIRPLGARRRLRRLRGRRTSAPGAWLRKDRRRCTAARRRRRRRRAGHQPAAAALQARRLAAARSPTALGELVRTNSEAILAVTAPGRLARLHQARRDHARASTPTPTRTSRPSPTATAATDVAALHAAGRRRHARHAAAASCSRAHAAPPAQRSRSCCDPRGWSRRTIILLVMQTLDNAIALRPKRALLGGDVRLQTEQDPEQPEPDVHPGRQPGGRVARRAHRRRSPQSSITEAVAQHPDDRAHPRRRGDRRATRRPASSTPPARVRLREPARLRRLGGPGERRRQPEPDDHRAGRARDEPTPRQDRFRSAGSPGDERLTPLRLPRAQAATASPVPPGSTFVG